MKLTVIGEYGGVPGKDKACNSFLLESGDRKILIDCGSGVISKLQKHIDLKDLTDIIITHFHYDHYIDLFVLMYAIKVGEKYNMMKPINIYCPATPKDIFDSIDIRFFKKISIKDINYEINIGDIKVSFERNWHGMESYAVKFEEGYAKISYTGDTGYDEDIIDFFNNSSLLIADSSLLKNQKKNIIHHMTTEEAVDMANNSNSRNLMLSHFWYQIEDKEYEKEAVEYNKNSNLNIFTAKEGMTFKIE